MNGYLIMRALDELCEPKFKGSVTYIGNGTNQTIDMFEEAVANFSK